MTRRVSTALLIAAITLAARAQQQPLVESIEVRVVNVDVVVTDRAGKPVSGLTKRDFQILEDGKPQTITNFYEVQRADSTADGKTAQEAPPRHFVFFIDDQSLHPTVRSQVLGALRTFVDARLRANDDASVVRWNGSLQIALGLTSDKEAIRNAIAAIANSPGSPVAVNTDFLRVQSHCLQDSELARTGRMQVPTAYGDCIEAARLETSVIISNSRRLMNAVNLALTTVGGAEGKKVLILAGANLPQSPGWDLYEWANSLFIPLMRGTFDAPMSKPLVEARTQRQMLETLARSANAHGVTMYLLDVPVPSDRTTIQSAGGAPDNGADFLRLGNTREAYETLADITGGMALIRPSDYAAALDRIAGDLESYYSLGYRPAEASRNDRAIAVQTTNRDYVVRGRRSYATRTADDQATDRVIANIFAPARSSDWKIGVRTGALEREGAKFKVPIDVTIPSTFTLLPDANNLAGGYTVYVAVGTTEGALSTVFRQPQPVTIPRQAEKQFRAEPQHFTATLTVAPGENLISIGVVDQIGSTVGFARTTIVAK